jgi:hypothetical protein
MDELVLLTRGEPPRVCFNLSLWLSGRYGLKLKRLCLCDDPPPGFEVLNQPPEEFVKKEKPFAVVLCREPLSPLEHIFTKGWAERLAEGLNGAHIFLLDGKNEKLSKALVYVPFREEGLKPYLESLKKVLHPLGVKVVLSTVVDEADELLPLLEKELPEAELENFLGFTATELLKRSLEQLKGLAKRFLILRGEAGTVLPLWAEKENFDLLVVPQNTVHRDEFVENSPVSLLLIWEGNSDG